MTVMSAAMSSAALVGFIRLVAVSSLSLAVLSACALFAYALTLTRADRREALVAAAWSAVGGGGADQRGAATVAACIDVARLDAEERASEAEVFGAAATLAAEVAVYCPDCVQHYRSFFPHLISGAETTMARAGGVGYPRTCAVHAISRRLTAEALAVGMPLSTDEALNPARLFAATHAHAEADLISAEGYYRNLLWPDLATDAQAVLACN